MINDSVREELKDKISPIIKPLNLERKPLMPTKIESPMAPPVFVTPPAPAILSRPVQTAVMPKPPRPPVIETADISVKPTAPTVFEFQNKNSAVPEWRLQLQNAVLQRQNRASISAHNIDAQPVPQAKLVTSGANALKPEPQPEPEAVFHHNPKVNSALQRIEQSRRKFLVIEQTEAVTVEVAPAAPGKNYPFRIATKAGEVVPAPVEAKPATINPTFKPNTAVSLITEKKEFDTNKLPKLAEKIAPSLDIHSTTPEEEEIAELKKTGIKLVPAEEIVSEEFIEAEEFEEIEDLAPFAMRFNAGLFDLIIGAFVSFILLTPFMMKSDGGWFTLAGFLAFSVTLAVVMFIYMTTSIGLYGRTFGMRIFSLEVVDIEGENYPTVHQAAVSSCLYLLSLALGGIGFLTLPFNPEKRAVHDLVSGTIVVKEA